MKKHLWIVVLAFLGVGLSCLCITAYAQESDPDECDPAFAYTGSCLLDPLELSETQSEALRSLQQNAFASRIDPALLAAIVSQESSFTADRVGDRMIQGFWCESLVEEDFYEDSECEFGAYGYMQLWFSAAYDSGFRGEERDLQSPMSYSEWFQFFRSRYFCTSDEDCREKFEAVYGSDRQKTKPLSELYNWFQGWAGRSSRFSCSDGEDCLNKFYAYLDWPMAGLNPDTNISHGSAYLRSRYRQFRDSPTYGEGIKNAVSAYNAGSPIKGNSDLYVTPVINLYRQFKEKLVRPPFLVQSKETNTIYWIQNKQRYPVLREVNTVDILDAMTHRELPKWGKEKVRKLPHVVLDEFQEVNGIVEGPTLFTPSSASDGLLIRKHDADQVHLVTNGALESLSPSEFDRRGFKRNDVIEVTEGILNLFSRAADIENLTLQQAVSRGFVKLESKGEFFGDGVTFIGTGQNDEDVIVKVRVGDAILTKNPGRQDMIVTQSQDILLPASEEVRKEGIWIACLDQGKSAPKSGEELDVTANLKEWPQQLARQLFEKLQDQEGSITQQDVWDLSDREDFPELSNPTKASPGSNFTASPELSLISIIAKHADNCPAAKPNPDNIICRREVKFATWLYFSDQSVPGTVQRRIDLETLREMVSFYITQTPTDRPPAGARSQQVDAQLAELLNQERSTSLKLTDVVMAPNPIRHTGAVRFSAIGTGIRNIEVDIYDLAGAKVFASNRVLNNTFTWHLQDAYGNVVANGVYLYLVTVRGAQGQVVRSEVRKLVVLK